MRPCAALPVGVQSTMLSKPPRRRTHARRPHPRPVIHLARQSAAACDSERAGAADDRRVRRVVPAGRGAGRHAARKVPGRGRRQRPGGTRAGRGRGAAARPRAEPVAGQPAGRRPRPLQHHQRLHDHALDRRDADLHARRQTQRARPALRARGRGGAGRAQRARRGRAARHRHRLVRAPRRRAAPGRAAAAARRVAAAARSGRSRAARRRAPRRPS